MPQNQTISYLSRKFAEIGIEPDSKRGQNFLIDMNLLKLLAASADLGPDDVALEVGTGTGALTDLLSERAGAVVSVELDEHLYRLATELLWSKRHVTLLHQDALRNKNNLDARVEEAVRQRLDEAPGRQLKLVANLPYSVATPVISNLLNWETLPVTMTVTIQKELADRIVAAPSTKDYSGLSIWIQCQCDVEIVRILPPSVFWPQPKVHSAIIQLRINEEKRRRVPDLPYFHNLIRSMFFHRRKFLRSNLLGAMKGRLGKPDVDDLMAELELAANARAEELEVPKLIELCEAVRRRAPDWKL